jgi:hypothetical protein
VTRLRLASLVVAVHTYAPEIYPRMKASFGGGDFGRVQLIGDSITAPVLMRLVPAHDDRMSPPWRFASDGGSHYTVLVEAATLLVHSARQETAVHREQVPGDEARRL